MAASAVLPRDRQTVWAELEAEDHPAWTDPPGTGPRRLESTPSFGVGAAWAVALPRVPGTTFRFVMYSETVAVTSGFSVTTETLWPQHQYVETLTLRDAVDGQTLATLHGTVSAHVGPLAGPSLIGARLQLIADRHLRRAAEWRPGDPHVSSVIPYDPSDPLTG